MQKTFKNQGIVILLIIGTFISWIDWDLLLFIVEISSIVIAFAIMAISVNTLEISNNSCFMFLGIAYGFVGGLNLVHTVHLNQIDVMSLEARNILKQLSLAARVLEGTSLLLFFKFLDKKVNYKLWFYIYLGIASFALVFILKFKIIPDYFIEGRTITEFQVISEITIFLALLYTIYLFYINGRLNRIKEYKMMIWSIAFTILSKGSIIIIQQLHLEKKFYLIGNLFKLLAFYLLYEAIIRSTLKASYDKIFNKLEKRKCELEIINNELNSKNKELERTKSNLEKSKKRYKKLIEMWPDAVLIRDEEKIIYANNAAVDLLKLKSKEDIVGKSILSIIYNEHIEIIKERIKRQNEGKEVPALEHKIICGDGSIIEVEAASAIVELEEKEVRLVILRNLTEEKKMEEMKDKLKETLEMDKLRTEFFSNLSHELRTPINVIYTALQLEDIYVKEKNFNGIEKYNKIVKQNCLRLLRISNNLIDITKIDAGFFKPSLSLCNIVPLIETITSSVISYVESKEMNIIFDTESEEYFVNCDPELIERIMLNLLSNAIKYGKEKGNISVEINYKEKNSIEIMVKDDGIGIPKDKQSEIFERFVQIDKSFARKCEGSGIGLSLVKSLVELQQGRISVESEEGVGSEFSITFPTMQVDDEICASIEERGQMYSAIEKISIEFSDIYS